MQQVPRALFVVRVREEERYWQGRSLETDAPFRMEGIFATREQAEAFAAEREQKAATAGDPGPLLDLRSLAELVSLSAFEPNVFRDWLVDHDIPDPETFKSTRRVQDYSTPVGEWLEALSPQQLADLYAALHHLRFYEILEVPFVFGDYTPEQWEEWEKALPDAATLGPEGWGFRDTEGGFLASPIGEPPEDYDWGSEDDVDSPGPPPYAQPDYQPPPPAATDDEIPY
jgi:hypothetical protein